MAEPRITPRASNNYRLTHGVFVAGTAPARRVTCSQFAQKLRQLGDIRRDPSCLVLREQLGHRSPAGLIFEIDIGNVAHRCSFKSVVDRVRRSGDGNRLGDRRRDHGNHYHRPAAYR